MSWKTDCSRKKKGFSSQCFPTDLEACVLFIKVFQAVSILKDLCSFSESDGEISMITMNLQVL